MRNFLYARANDYKSDLCFDMPTRVFRVVNFVSRYREASRSDYDSAPLTGLCHATPYFRQSIYPKTHHAHDSPSVDAVFLLPQLDADNVPICHAPPIPYFAARSPASNRLDGMMLPAQHAPPFFPCVPPKEAQNQHRPTALKSDVMPGNPRARAVTGPKLQLGAAFANVKNGSKTIFRALIRRYRVLAMRRSLSPLYIYPSKDRWWMWRFHGPLHTRYPVRWGGGIKTLLYIFTAVIILAA